jgi:transcriptional regulator with XRE-family HTH domain
MAKWNSLKIKELRTKKNLTQKDVANSLGISPQTLSRWENGETLPHYTFIDKLHEYFKCDFNELCDFEQFKKDIAKGSDIDINKL